MLNLHMFQRQGRRRGGAPLGLWAADELAEAVEGGEGAHKPARLDPGPPGQLVAGIGAVPDHVAAVEIRLSNGRRLMVEPVDGYYYAYYHYSEFDRPRIRVTRVTLHQ